MHLSFVSHGQALTWALAWASGFGGGREPGRALTWGSEMGLFRWDESQHGFERRPFTFVFSL